MEPGILQTCKQIYHEVNTMLYSQNIFTISEPGQMFQFIKQIGLININLVKTLRIRVPRMANLAACLQLLHVLAKEAISRFEFRSI